MPNDFITGTDWEQSSGPIIARMVHLADCWPQGTGAMGEIAGGDKDVLVNGNHPAFAVGAKANRPNNLVGVVMTYEPAADLVILNMADKFISRQWVANVLSYGTSVPNAWDAHLELGDPVYIDDSEALSPGCTLSRSPRNQANSANPLFGYIWYCQDDYADEGVGGPNHVKKLPHEGLGTYQEHLLCVMQVNDSGQASL
jgi:hypothetical protein